MAPAETETAAIIAVDHSNVLTRRRRSAMKLGQLARRDAGKYPGRGGAPVQGTKRRKRAAQAARALNPAPLTARANAPNSDEDGDGVPREPPATADDSYRERWRWESAPKPPRAAFLLP